MSTRPREVVLQALRAIRHSALVRKQTKLVDAVKRIYGWLIDPIGLGVEVTLPDSATNIRIPGKHFDHEWSTYEAEITSKSLEFIKTCAKPCVLDVGASVGQFTVSSLGANPYSRVFAFESDLGSLLILEDMCKFYGLDRVREIYGLISEAHESKASLDSILSQTEGLLETRRKSQDREAPKYISIGDKNNSTSSIPVHSLDGLLSKASQFKNTLGSDGKILLKIDVEGAEFLVLKGARELLKDFKPSLSLSVHPFWLPQFGGSRDEIKDFLTNLGYHIEHLATDHEEHWWCEPKTGA